MARKTKEEAERTRNEILDVAERLFFEHGVSRTSLEAVARGAGVTRGAVYWHFRNKADLFEAMQERVRLPQEDIIEQMATLPEIDLLSTLKEACTDVLVSIARDERRRRVYAILLHRCEYVEEMTMVAERRQRASEQSIKSLTRVFERVEREEEMAAGWTPAVAAIGLHGLLIGLCSDWLKHPESYDLAEIAPKCMEAFFGCFRQVPGTTRC